MDAFVSHGLPAATAAAPAPAGTALRATQSLLTWPFDALRWSYAAAVQAGFVRRSMLGSPDLERLLASMERAALGSLARSV